MTVSEYLEKLHILQSDIQNNPMLNKVYSDINPQRKIKQLEYEMKHLPVPRIAKETQREIKLSQDEIDLNTALELFHNS